MLRVTVAAVGGRRLFLLMCLVNLLKPLPNCSGTLMLSFYGSYHLDHSGPSDRGHLGELFSSLAGRVNPDGFERAFPSEYQVRTTKLPTYSTGIP